MHPLLIVLLLHHVDGTSHDETPNALYDRLSTQVLAAFDSSRGGFVAKGGIPLESAVELAMTRAKSPGQTQWRSAANFTLRWTHGLMDTLTGGYYHARGGADGEGMDAIVRRADSNARRLELLIQAWQATGDESYRRDATRVVAWFDRVLIDGRGGFVSAAVGDRDLEPDANGQAIHAWLMWAAVSQDPRQRDFALKSLDRVWTTCWTPGFGLMRKNSFGEVLREPLLADQVEMGRALVLAARMCGRSADLVRARMLGDLVVSRFEEKGLGGFRTQSVPSKSGSIKKARRIPQENARAARFLCELAAATGQAAYRESASRAWKSHDKALAKMGLEAAEWAMAIRASYRADLPGPVSWASPEEPPARKRSVTIKTRR
jgi:uncharacterized protein YyaL (SSP411 family)